MTRRVGIVLAALLAVLTANAIIVGRERSTATPFGGGRVLELDGPDLNVREYGPNNGRAIVLLHGYAASIEWWDPVAERLAAEGNRVIAVDLVGHGGSEAPADDEAYSADSSRMRSWPRSRELDVRRADLVGHSMGGDVATAIVERFPSLVERVVVIDTFAAPGLLDEGVLARAACWPIVGAALDRLRSLDAASESSLQTAFAPDYPVPDVAHRSLERLDSPGSVRGGRRRSHERADAGRRAARGGEGSRPRRLGRPRHASADRSQRRALQGGRDADEGHLSLGAQPQSRDTGCAGKDLDPIHWIYQERPGTCIERSSPTESAPRGDT